MIAPSAMQTVDFQHLKRKPSPNNFLLCPPLYCEETPDVLSAVYPLNYKILYTYWNKMISRQPRVSVILINEDQHQYTYVQRSKWFRFPDYITIEFIPLDENNTQLAIYSRAQYGYYDFGVNQHRVKSWVSEFEQGLPYRAVPTFPQKQR